MPRLVDVNAIDWSEIEEEYGKRSKETIAFETLIEAQPTVDVVEVVRCKDCFICETRQTANYLPFLYCELHDCSVLGDFYCSWGERREDG